MIEFEWDHNNIKHICEDYPERRNTIFEVESVFYDPDVLIYEKDQVSHEQRFYAVGKSVTGILQMVVHTVNNSNRIRPISCWPANTQTKRRYYENRKK